MRTGVSTPASSSIRSAPPTPPSIDGDLTEWEYDSDTGLLVTKTDEEDESTTYTYTRGGQVLTRTWARDSGGVTTTYSYALGASLPGDDSGVSTISGKLTKVDYSGISPATPGVTLEYDRLGRLTEVTDATGSRAFAYEDGGDLGIDTETLNGDLDKTLDWYRDAKGRRSGFAVTGLSSLTYTYDTRGRLDTIHQGVPGDPIADYAYVSQSLHLVATVALNDGAYSVTNTWEDHRDILDTKVNKAGATPISSYDYSVNTQGQRTGVAMSGSAFSGTPSWGWTYNDTGEVTAAEHSASTPYNRAYEYDGLGNREQSSSGATDPVDYPWSSGTVRAYTPNTLNQYSALTYPSASPVHDEDGNLTNDGTHAYVWDAENRLAEVWDHTETDLIATYTYDYLGRRVRKVTTADAPQGSTDILYLYDGWNLIAEYSLHHSSFILQTSFVWGPDLSGSLQGAGGVGGLLRVTDHAGPTHYFPTYDGNGNVSEYLTGASTVSTHFEYNAFGNVVNTPASPTSANFRFQFSTKPVDRETGFSYYGFRYLDPLTGRWLSRDPIGEIGGINLYGFVKNGGVNRLDALGLWEPGTDPARPGFAPHPTSGSTWEPIRYDGTYVNDQLNFSSRCCDDKGNLVNRVKDDFGRKCCPWDLRKVAYEYRRTRHNWRFTWYGVPDYLGMDIGHAQVRTPNLTWGIWLLTGKGFSAGLWSSGGGEDPNMEESIEFKACPRTIEVIDGRLKEDQAAPPSYFGMYGCSGYACDVLNDAKLMLPLLMTFGPHPGDVIAWK